MGFIAPGAEISEFWSIRLVNRHHTVRAPKRVGKNFRKKKKREKTSNNLNFLNFDRSKCSGVEFTFCNKSADTSEWFVPISASRRRRGV